MCNVLRGLEHWSELNCRLCVTDACPLAVVNRIAAGEVIQRPANAIKELLENSIDAGATAIVVAVSDGGLRSFSVQDDGSGIRVEDLPILCERHTTSKLQSFDDLRHIASYGFRGEALASISHVARMTVTTMTAGSPCAYRASYMAGVFEDGKPPVACAGNRGTIIQADELFYNLRQRREALRNPAEEMKKIIHVVQRYALHFSGRVSFVLRKQGAASPELFTQSGADLDANVGALFGGDVARELLCIGSVESGALEGVRIDARVSSINYIAGKRMQMVLFINDRLVDCAPLKRVVQDVYTRCGLTKGRFPFAYISLAMQPENVDVNVHPTKQEVRFRHEDEIVARVEQLLEAKLKESASVSRAFHVNNSARVADAVSVLSYSDRVLQSYASEANPVWREVRVSAKEQKLDAFVTRKGGVGAPTSSQVAAVRAAGSVDEESVGAAGGAGTGNNDGNYDDDDDEERNQFRESSARRRRVSLSSQSSQSPGVGAPAAAAQRSQFTPSAAALSSRKRLKRRKTLLTSVLELLDELDVDAHAGLAELLHEHVFVGFVDANRVLLQHRLNLYLVNVAPVMRAFLYGEVLEQFQGFPPLVLSDPPALHELLRLALSCPYAPPSGSDGDSVVAAAAPAHDFAALSEADQVAIIETCLKSLKPRRGSCIAGCAKMCSLTPMYARAPHRDAARVLWD